MQKIPKALNTIINECYTQSRISPTDFPVIDIRYHGCGDSGGIESVMFLTHEGAKLAHMNKVPGAWPKEDMKKFYATTTHSYVISADKSTTSTVPLEADLSDRQVASNWYQIEKWIYEKFGLCEINDGCMADIFVSQPLGNVWGRRTDFVTEEHVTEFPYEN
jgi:hypothetical protein